MRNFNVPAKFRVYQSTILQMTSHKLHISYSVCGGLGENEVEQIGKAGIRKANILALGEACKAVLYHIPDLTGGTFLVALDIK